MIGIFKQKNSGNVLLLLVYALVLKFHLFLHPAPPVTGPEDHYLYNWLLALLDRMHFSALAYTILAFLLLFTQASLFNRICNERKMLVKTNYLPGMAYLLATSLFADWNYFSAPLLINTILIWLFYRMTNLHNAARPGNAIFNIGLLMGLVTLFYQPAIVFILLVWLALFIMRPFHIREWLISILGMTAPYYFLAIVLFLTNQWSWKTLLPVVSFSLPAMPSSIFTTISIILLVLPFFIGGLFIQSNLSKMLIQVRKNWSVLLLFLIISVLIILSNGGKNYVNWVLCIVPLSAFHAAAYYYPRNKVMPLVLHWLLFGYAIYLNYWM